mmetsp:Transcript_23591/g.23260  ORF Transcript_23591/g.23260 Transcript_23591/m.23260 type:complete len:180 (-) Transcript_23591:588-1127(-)
MRALCCAGKNNPYFVVSRARGFDRAEEFVRVFKSATLTNNPNPVFNSVKIKSSQFCNGEKNLPIKIEFYSYEENNNDQCYGECLTTVAELQDKKTFEVVGKKGGGRLIVDSFLLIEMPSFMDYLRSGWAINLSCSIDYTASNLDIDDPLSLHRQNIQGQPNQYEQAILSVGRVLEPYAF